MSFQWTDAQVRRALSLGMDGASEAVRYAGVSTDSRKIGAGDLYVALAGERFDGHDFVAKAVASGASGVVVARGRADDLRAALASVAGSDGGGSTAPTVYAVDDTLFALGRLAHHRRQALPARVVGITGSSGKTGTKDLAAAAIGAALRVHATQGNLNNLVGVPLTLLAAPEDAQVVVAEMGTNQPGEIAALAAIARPDIGVVTTVGESHLEGLGSIEGVLVEKLSLLQGLSGLYQGVVGDSPTELPRMAREILFNARVAGWTDFADRDLRPQEPELTGRGTYAFKWRGEPVQLALPGKHAVTNAIIALAVAEMLGVSAADAAHGISTARPGWMRGEVRDLGKLSLILDCYNANPQSTVAALDILEAWDAPRRVAVLGTMRELGAGSASLHERVLAEALQKNVDVVVATGDYAEVASAAVDKAARSRRDGSGAGPDAGGAPDLVVAESIEDAYAQLRGRLHGNEVILLKASRGFALERIVPLFEADFGTGEPTAQETAH